MGCLRENFVDASITYCERFSAGMVAMCKTLCLWVGLKVRKGRDQGERGTSMRTQRWELHGLTVCKQTSGLTEPCTCPLLSVLSY